MRIISVIAAFAVSTVVCTDILPSKSGVVEPTSILTRNLRGEVHEAFNRRPRPVFGTVSSNDESTSADAPAAANGYQTPTRKRKIDEAELLLNFATSNNAGAVGRQHKKSLPPLDNRIRSDKIDTKQLMNVGKLHQKWRDQYQESTELKVAPEHVKQKAQAKDFFKYYQKHPSPDQIDKKQLDNLGKHYKKWREEVYQESTDLKDAPEDVKKLAKAKEFVNYIQKHSSNTNKRVRGDQNTATAHGASKHKSSITTVAHTLNGGGTATTGRSPLRENNEFVRRRFGTLSSNDESTSSNSPAPADRYQTPSRKRKIDEAELLLNFAASNNAGAVGRQHKKSLPPLDNPLRSDEIDTKKLINVGKFFKKWRDEVYQESTDLKNAPENVKEMAQAKGFLKYIQKHPSPEQIDKKQLDNLGKHYKKWREEVYQESTDLKDAPEDVKKKAKVKEFLKYIQKHSSNTNERVRGDQNTATAHGASKHKSSITTVAHTLNGGGTATTRRSPLRENDQFARRRFDAQRKRMSMDLEEENKPESNIVGGVNNGPGKGKQLPNW